MNCQQFGQIVVDLGRSDNLDPAVREDALNHTQSCPRCAARLSEELKLTEGLRAVKVATENEQAAARVELGLLSAYRTRFDASRPATVGRSGFRTARVGWRVWGVAVAAMLVLSLAAVWKLRPTSHGRSVDVAGSRQGAHKEAGKAAVVRSGETHPASAVARQVVSRPRQTAKYGARWKRLRTPEQTAPTEATTGFYPLPYGSGLGLDEGWTLVRVQVRRSSLAALGVPVDGGLAAGEMLTADVVVGQDGLARGIRFVE